MSTNKICIFIALHKHYKIPNDTIYYPIHVGKIGKKNIGFQGDDTGNNISEKNSFFNEMTGVYWAWKNVDADYYGLVHYRRHFTTESIFKRIFYRDRIELAVKRDKLDYLLKETDIVLPSKRKYFIETIESHYINLPYSIETDLDVIKGILKADYPDYYVSFEKLMSKTYAHMFNMFIMEKTKFQEYCNWVFPILFEFEKRINHVGRTAVQDRLYISEFMLDTWLETNDYTYKELPVLFVERENYLKKAFLLLKRKLF